MIHVNKLSWPCNCIFYSKPIHGRPPILVVWLWRRLAKGVAVADFLPCVKILQKQERRSTDQDGSALRPTVHSDILFWNKTCGQRWQFELFNESMHSSSLVFWKHSVQRNPTRRVIWSWLLLLKHASFARLIALLVSTCCHLAQYM